MTISGGLRARIRGGVMKFSPILALDRTGLRLSFPTPSASVPGLHLATYWHALLHEEMNDSVADHTCRMIWSSDDPTTTNKKKARTTCPPPQRKRQRGNEPNMSATSAEVSSSHFVQETAAAICCVESSRWSAGVMLLLTSMLSAVVTDCELCLPPPRPQESAGNSCKDKEGAAGLSLMFGFALLGLFLSRVIGACGGFA
eukprot:2025201-Rhodomonas_salina.1